MFHDWLMIIGLIGVLMMNGSALPQIYKTYKKKQVNDMSIWRELMLLFGVLFYLLYGIGINNVVIIISNTLAMIIFIILVYFHIKYGGKNELGKKID
ncbi:MAG: SemiSWEET family transporter [Candidatus Helarchaeota archaeon]